MESHVSRVIALTLVVLVAAAPSGSSGWAAPVPSQTSSGSLEQADEEALAAERELVKATLMGFGLTDEEATSRVDLLTDHEVHMLASDLESVQAAGMSADTTNTLLLLVLIAVLVVAIAGGVTSS